MKKLWKRYLRGAKKRQVEEKYEERRKTNARAQTPTPVFLFHKAKCAQAKTRHNNMIVRDPCALPHTRVKASVQIVI